MSCSSWLARRVVRFFPAVAVSVLFCSISHAAFTEVVVLESFDSRANTFAFETGVGGDGATSAISLVDQGGGDQALRLTGASAATGFFSAGFRLSTLELEPGPAGPNKSPTLANYQLSLDLTINAIDEYTPNLEIWLADGPRFSTYNANLYTARGLTNGTQTIAFTLDQNLTTTTPHGFRSGSGQWSPTADDWWIQANIVDFSAPAGVAVDYTIDNFQVRTVPEPGSLLMLGVACLWLCFAGRLP